MSLQDKYRAVLDLGLEYKAQEGYVEETDGLLRIGGTVETQFQKDSMWDAIKEVGGNEPNDIEADINVSQTEYYHKHTVAKGETLGGIAKHYFKGNVMKYKDIFAANTDVLKNPDVIHPGQELTIPFPS